MAPIQRAASDMKTLKLKDLFLDELADIYNAENRLLQALPRMAEAAACEDLKEAFTDHLEQTRGHVAKVKEVFALMGTPARGKTCEATVGLVKEAENLIADFRGSPALDAGLIAAGQKVEHYEIASYGCLREWALALDNEKAADLLQEILEEEEAANQTLTQVAEMDANEEALGGVEPGSATPKSKSQKNIASNAGIPAGVGGQPENDEDARAAGLASATDPGPAKKN
jgi:ferritin-like metal-binding protein YciE